MYYSELLLIPFFSAFDLVVLVVLAAHAGLLCFLPIVRFGALLVASQLC
jgi:hypothetical protein